MLCKCNNIFSRDSDMHCSHAPLRFSFNLQIARGAPARDNMFSVLNELERKININRTEFAQKVRAWMVHYAIFCIVCVVWGGGCWNGLRLCERSPVMAFTPAVLYRAHATLWFAHKCDCNLLILSFSLVMQYSARFVSVCFGLSMSRQEENALLLGNLFLCAMSACNYGQQWALCKVFLFFLCGRS